MTQSAIRPPGFGVFKILMNCFFTLTKLVCCHRDPLLQRGSLRKSSCTTQFPSKFFFKKVYKWTTLTCSQSTIRLANGGLNCQVCCNDKPSMSKMTWAPATWVAGSIIAASRKITAPLYTSSNEHFLCFHLSENWIKQNQSSKMDTNG